MLHVTAGTESNSTFLRESAAVWQSRMICGMREQAASFSVASLAAGVVAVVAAFVVTLGYAWVPLVAGLAAVALGIVAASRAHGTDLIRASLGALTGLAALGITAWWFGG